MSEKTDYYAYTTIADYHPFNYLAHFIQFGT